MNPQAPVIVVLVTPSTPSRQPAALLRWLRWLLPAALLVVSPTPLVFPGVDGVITLDAEAVESSPLAVADAVVKAREGR